MHSTKQERFAGELPQEALSGNNQINSWFDFLFPVLGHLIGMRLLACQMWGFSFSSGLDHC